MRFACALAALAGSVLCAAAPACAQEPGRPNLTGTWSNASVTQLTRRSGTPLVVSPEEAARMGDNSFWVRSLERDARGVTPDLDDGNVASGYNAGWMDPGATVARVGGEYRASWLVEPADGQLPLTEAGEVARRVAAQRQRATDNPEELAPNDRCLIASRGTGGPGMLNNLYNNNFEFLQTDDHLLIVVEMVHDARIIPIFETKAQAQAGHGPDGVRVWLGNSTGWWQGETLVVETVNVHPDQAAYGPIFLSENGRVTERFTRVSEDEIFYAFEVEDAHYYSQPWRAEMTLSALDGEVYEYACHEGNYAMEGILAGAREEERSAAAD